MEAFFVSHLRRDEIEIPCGVEQLIYLVMVFSFLWSIFKNLFSKIFSMLGISPKKAISNGLLPLHFKFRGRTVQVQVDPSWSIHQVKRHIAPLLGLDCSEILIIFAGQELPNEFLLKESDLGEHSYLHAVQIQTTVVSNVPNVLENPHPRTKNFSVPSPYPEPEQNVDNVDVENTEQAGWQSSSSKSDFFLYCSDCGDLREGKLRVRCSSCLSGAFTLSRHPEQWEDVLRPCKVGGSCQQEGCSGAFAQFYFRCTGHMTKGEDDSAPALSLLRRNREEVPCLACGDVKEIVLLFPCPPAHATCVDCFKDYALVKLNQREFLQDAVVGYTLGCPALCQNSLIADHHHFKLLGKYQYDRYQRFGTEECLMQMGGIFCPQPDCGMGIIPADNNCDKIACLHGCGGWHVGNCRDGETPAEDCSAGGYRSVGYFVSQDRAAAAQWGDASRRAMRLSTKPCPNCRVPTERAGGCMHMECTKCKFQWCWVCQTTWSRDCMGNHWFG